MRTVSLPFTCETIDGNAEPTIPELRELLADSSEIDRSSINTWEDTEFRQAVESTVRTKLIMTALWTEMCLAFPSLGALQTGYELYPAADAVAGKSPEAHPAGLQRIVQAGAQPISWLGLAGELQRDWVRRATAREVGVERRLGLPPS